jgi:hypothetical protein
VGVLREVLATERTLWRVVEIGECPPIRRGDWAGVGNLEL